MHQCVLKKAWITNYIHNLKLLQLIKSWNLSHKDMISTHTWFTNHWAPSYSRSRSSTHLNFCYLKINKLSPQSINTSMWTVAWWLLKTASSVHYLVFRIRWQNLVFLHACTQKLVDATTSTNNKDKK